MMIKILRQLCFFIWKLKLMFLKTAFPRALVKTEAMMPLPLHFSRPTGTKKEERVAYLCEPQVNFSRNISAFG